jgi:S1-C subfamily serine protease
MKKILIILTFFMFGFSHIETLKNTFGCIKGFYKVKVKTTDNCMNCSGTFKDIEKINKINKKFHDIPYISASAFIVKHVGNRTILMTAGHVCDELKKFTTNTKFKKLGLSVYNYINTNKGIFESKTLKNNYFINSEIVVYSFLGNEYVIDKIISIDNKHDICLLSTQSKWGVKVEFAKKDCQYEEVLNMSASGGYYYPNAVPLRKGIINSLIKRQVYGNKVYRNVNLYTLHVKQGASGSAVFNKQGKVCGSINISYIKLDLSSGASRLNLIRFLEINKNNL